MQKAPSGIKTMIDALTASGERSPLFLWFVENHTEFKAGMTGHRIRWSVVAEQAVAMGLTNRLGGNPTANLAKTTWHRACKFVAARQPPQASNPSSNVAFPIPRQADIAPPLVTRSTDLQVLQEVQLPHEDPSVVVSPSKLELPSRPTPSEIEEVVALPAHLSPGSALTSLPEPEPEWTPAQIAHRDEQIAKARALCDHHDRFDRL